MKAHLIAALAGFLALTQPVVANPTNSVELQQRAVQQLLDRAESHMRSHGDKALSTFSQSGQFRDGELYVYVLAADGEFLASGGSSMALIGQNVRDKTDSDGKAFFREILEGARTKPQGSVEYRWFNLARGKTEKKIATYRALGNRILVVGYYENTGTPELAHSLLWCAAHELKQHGTAALERFNDANGGFVQDDLYVFVVDLGQGKIVAHGTNPRLIGRNFNELVDASGKPFGRMALAEIQKKPQTTEGEIEYVWRNPLNQKYERKKTFYVRVGNYMLAVGAYLGPARAPSAP